MPMIPVRDINLQNRDFLNIINEYKDFLLRRDDDEDLPFAAKHLKIRHENEKPEDWLSDNYLQNLISEGKGHCGYPRILKGFQGLKWDDPDGIPEIKDKTDKLNSSLIEFLSCRNNALNALYPPGGFISWHNNANAKGYNIIITYSETGEGWFDYWDVDKKERVRIQDKPGWQAKMSYFGPYDEPDKLCYHAAYTDCYRLTIAFVFAEANEFWEEVIADLESPC
jgi:hypothetical protein